jgi:hypothetical protein
MSRIILQIIDIRVERLRAISVKDAIEEGVSYRSSGGNSYYPPRDPERAGSAPYYAYQALWESINGPGSWDINPYVWAITFTRI